MKVIPSELSKLRGREKAEREAAKKAAWEWEHGGREKADSERREQEHEDWRIGGSNNFDTTPFINKK